MILNKIFKSKQERNFNFSTAREEEVIRYVSDAIHIYNSIVNRSVWKELTDYLTDKYPGTVEDTGKTYIELYDEAMKYAKPFTPMEVRKSIRRSPVMLIIDCLDAYFHPEKEEYQRKYDENYYIENGFYEDKKKFSLHLMYWNKKWLLTNLCCNLFITKKYRDEAYHLNKFYTEEKADKSIRESMIGLSWYEDNLDKVFDEFMEDEDNNLDECFRAAWVLFYHIVTNIPSDLYEVLDAMSKKRYLKAWELGSSVRSGTYGILRRSADFGTIKGNKAAYNYAFACAYDVINGKSEVFLPFQGTKFERK